MIDTPGSADTQGMDIRNQEDMTAKIRSLEAVDAVIIVWKAEQGMRFTSEIMDAVGIVRLAFGPRVWKRLIFVYTFVNWQQIDPFIPTQRQCLSTEDFKRTEHKEVIKAIYDYVNGTLKAPDLLCSASDDANCFPSYDHIPFIGSGLSIDVIRARGRIPGFNIFNPEDPLYASSPCQNDAEAFELLRNSAMQLRSSPSLATDSMVNMFVECELALLNITAAKKLLSKGKSSKERLKPILRAAACEMTTCWSSKIGRYVERAAGSLLGDTQLQVELAFALLDAGQSEFVDFSNGFNAIRKHDLQLYPDAEVYLDCTHDLDIARKQRCYIILEHYYKANRTSNQEVCRERRDRLDVFTANIVCTCDHVDFSPDNSFTCLGFSGLGGRCPKGYTCDSPPFAVDMHGADSLNAYEQYCSLAAVCKASACDGYLYYLDSEKTNDVCDSSQGCRAAECCLPSATCSVFGCRGTLSNYGSGTLCHGPPEYCNREKCCYCAWWNIFDLGIGCLVGLSELEPDTAIDAFGGSGKSATTYMTIMVTSAFALVAMASLVLAFRRCPVRRGQSHSGAQPLLRSA